MKQTKTIEKKSSIVVLVPGHFTVLMFLDHKTKLSE